MPKRSNVYVYPNGEDGNALGIFIKYFIEKGKISSLSFIDDGSCETSFESNYLNVVNDGVLFLAHQDNAIYEKLLDNAKILPKNLVYNGINYIEDMLYIELCSIDFYKLCDNAINEEYKLMSYCAYFVGQFYYSIDQEGKFFREFIKIVFRINKYFKDYFRIPANSVAISVSSFASGKHLGYIGDILEDSGVYVVYIYHDIDQFKLAKNVKNAIYCPLACSFCGCYFDFFGLLVTILMPLSMPNIGSKKIYVSHAFVDPIASLVQRKRALDDLWFKKKWHINGYRMVTSRSNYMIFKDEFEKHGYEEELICAGYPSLDSSIREYDSFISKNNIACPNDILIAIHMSDSYKIIDSFLEEFNINFPTSKVYFRPYPADIYNDNNIKIFNKYTHESWFVYDDSKKLDSEIMNRCCVLIGDYSSMVYTFPLTTLKPAILLQHSDEQFDNCYNGISFLNDKIHFSARSHEDCFNIIREIYKLDVSYRKQMADDILKFREEEVFNLGNSSRFISDFIIKKLEEIRKSES